jgi:hypothetical protein
MSSLLRSLILKHGTLYFCPYEFSYMPVAMHLNVEDILSIDFGVCIVTSGIKCAVTAVTEIPKCSGVN